MGTKSIRLNSKEEFQLKKVTEYYHTTFKDLIKNIIHEKAEELSDIDFIENNSSIGSNDTIPINNVTDYLDSL